MSRTYSPYVEVEWSREPITVEEWALLNRLQRGDIDGGVELLVSRSNGALQGSQVRKADLDAWKQWVGGMHEGLSVATAPSAAKQVEELIKARHQLPDNMRFRDGFIEVIDSPKPREAMESIDLRKLLGDIDMTSPEQSE